MQNSQTQQRLLLLGPPIIGPTSPNSDIRPYLVKALMQTDPQLTRGEAKKYANEFVDDGADAFERKREEWVSLLGEKTGVAVYRRFMRQQIVRKYVRRTDQPSSSPTCRFSICGIFAFLLSVEKQYITMLASMGDDSRMGKGDDDDDDDGEHQSSNDKTVDPVHPPTTIAAPKGQTPQGKTTQGKPPQGKPPQGKPPQGNPLRGRTPHRQGPPSVKPDEAQRSAKSLNALPQMNEDEDGDDEEYVYIPSYSTIQASEPGSFPFHTLRPSPTRGRRGRGREL